MDAEQKKLLCRRVGRNLEAGGSVAKRVEAHVLRLRVCVMMPMVMMVIMMMMMKV